MIDQDNIAFMKEEQNNNLKMKTLATQNNLQQIFSNSNLFSNYRKNSESDEEDDNQEKGFLNGNNRFIF